MVHIQQEIHQRPSVASEKKVETQSAIRKQRTRQLASRDSLWYLMALLNTSICVVSTHRSPIEIATGDGIIDMLLNLLEPGDDRDRLSLIEENIVLGIVEKAWTAGWFTMYTLEKGMK
jgi:hypothetical protein